MNPTGTKKSLRAAQTNNVNAEKSGVYSARRQADEASKFKEDFAKDPGQFLRQNRLKILFRACAMTELLERDIQKNGVCDRRGEQRRAVGTHRRYLELSQKLNDEIQAEMDVETAISDEAESWSEGLGVRLLLAIALNYQTSPSASVAAIRLLFDRAPVVEANPDVEFFLKLESMTEEELEGELRALSVPVTTGFKRGPEYEPRKMIRRLAAQSDIEREELRDLLGALMGEFPPPRAGPERNDSEACQSEPHRKDGAPRPLYRSDAKIPTRHLIRCVRAGDGGEPTAPETPRARARSHSSTSDTGERGGSTRHSHSTDELRHCRACWRSPLRAPASRLRPVLDRLP